MPKVFKERMSPAVGQRSRYQQKGLVKRNTHAKYESPISHGKKVIIKPKV